MNLLKIVVIIVLCTIYLCVHDFRIEFKGQHLFTLFSVHFYLGLGGGSQRGCQTHSKYFYLLNSLNGLRFF